MIKTPENTFCTYCNQKITRKFVDPRSPMFYCNRKCFRKHVHSLTHHNIKCNECGKEFSKAINRTTKNNFCSQSCFGTYTNKHRTHGYRRSKLEIWLQTQLKQLYPNLKILYNHKETIKSELDIYIPELKLAFELNGVFHYEPIYSQEKLQQIQNNDNRKFQACLENNIQLCIIDTSKQKYFKESTSWQFLDIIKMVIDGNQTRTPN